MYIQLSIQYELLPLKILHTSVGTAAPAEFSQDVVWNPALNLTDSEVMCQSIFSLLLGLYLVNMYIHENLNYIVFLPVNFRILI